MVGRGEDSSEKKGAALKGESKVSCVKQLGESGGYPDTPGTR